MIRGVIDFALLHNEPMSRLLCVAWTHGLVALSIHRIFTGIFKDRVRSTTGR